MDRLRLGVIGLGWPGEIHCEANASVPNIELAALGTRSPERLVAMAAKFGAAKATRNYRELLADPEIDAVRSSRCGTSIPNRRSRRRNPPAPAR
jgi:UDP-N-acetylglucosamine 3-dehydrogenase